MDVPELVIEDSPCVVLYGSAQVDEIGEWVDNHDGPLSVFLYEKFVARIEEDDVENIHVEIRLFDDQSAIVIVLDDEEADYTVTDKQEYIILEELVKELGDNVVSEKVIGVHIDVIPTVCVEGDLRDALEWYNSRCADCDVEGASAMWIQFVYYTIEDRHGVILQEAIKLLFICHELHSGENQIELTHTITMQDEEMRALPRLLYSAGISLSTH